MPGVTADAAGHRTGATVVKASHVRGTAILRLGAPGKGNLITGQRRADLFKERDNRFQPLQIPLDLEQLDMVGRLQLAAAAQRACGTT